MRKTRVNDSYKQTIKKYQKHNFRMRRHEIRRILNKATELEIHEFYDFDLEPTAEESEAYY